MGNNGSAAWTELMKQRAWMRERVAELRELLILDAKKLGEAITDLERVETEIAAILTGPSRN